MSAPMDQDGGFRHLWRTSAPLMISFFAGFFMLFVDRMFLARYSLVAHNAAVNAGMMAWTFVLGMQTLCQMSEVFVAQYNGARQYERIATPVWTMIWVALASSVVFVPMAWFLGPHLFVPSLAGYEMKQVYFFWMLLGAPVSGMLGALQAFFIGRGATRVITVCALLGNAVNIILDPLLIFGIDGYLPSMGVKGAAIATQLGIVLQLFVLGSLFLKREYRERFGTKYWRFRFERLCAYLPVAAPSALMAVLEIGGWSMFYAMMARVSDMHILVSGICQDVIILMLFFGLGLEKGVAVIAGNLMGARRLDGLDALVLRAVGISIAFVTLVTLGFAIYPQPLLWLFLSQADHAGALSGIGSTDLLYSLTYSCVLISFLYIAIDQLKMIVTGVLSAAGDTMVLMLTNAACIWTFLLVPTYYLIVLKGGSVQLSIWIWIACVSVQFLVLWRRFRADAWRHRDLVAQ